MVTTVFSVSTTASRNSLQLRIKINSAVATAPPLINGRVTRKCACQRYIPSIITASSISAGMSSIKLFSIQNANGTVKAA